MGNCDCSCHVNLEGRCFRCFECTCGVEFALEYLTMWVRHHAPGLKRVREARYARLRERLNKIRESYFGPLS
jgi:hypothetical protein